MRPGSKVHLQGPDSGTIAVFVADEQSAHPVEVDRWAQLAERVLAEEGVSGDAELSVLFVDETHMAELNQQFMGHAGPTDVLSFPLDAVADDRRDDALDRTPDVVASGTAPLDRAITDPDDQPLLLGDVVVCPAVAARNAAQHAGTFDDEVALLIVHGILHVLGMDHAEADERTAMQARERALLERFHGPLARDPWS